MADRKVAFITGASRGIGRGCALELAKRGFDLVLTARTVTGEERFEYSSTLKRAATKPLPGSLQQTAHEAEALGAAALVAKLDLSVRADWPAAVDAAVARFGRIDVLVNNAGLGGSVAVTDMSDEQWHKVLDVSLTSVFRLTRATLPHMYQNGAGAIVNNASVLGWRAQALQAHYAAAKAGVMAFTRCAAIEAAAHGVRINAVAPSIAMHAFLNRVTSDELLAELKRREAFGRTAEVWEVANVIVFLASDLASYMTGEVVSVSSQHA